MATMGPCPQTSAPRPEQERRGYPPLSALRRSRDRPQDRRRLRRPRPVRRHRPAHLPDPVRRPGRLRRLRPAALRAGLAARPRGRARPSPRASGCSTAASKSSLSTVLAIVVVLVVGLAATGALLDSGPGLGGLGVLIVVVGPRGPARCATANAPGRSTRAGPADSPVAAAGRAGCLRPDARAPPTPRPRLPPTRRRRVVLRADRAAAAAAAGGPGYPVYAPPPPAAAARRPRSGRSSVGSRSASR